MMFEKKEIQNIANLPRHSQERGCDVGRAPGLSSHQNALC